MHGSQADTTQWLVKVYLQAPCERDPVGRGNWHLAHLQTVVHGVAQGYEATADQQYVLPRVPELRALPIICRHAALGNFVVDDHLHSQAEWLSVQHPLWASQTKTPYGDVQLWHQI